VTKLISPSKKAQTALEFFMIMGAILFFFLSFVGLTYASIEQRNFERKDIALGSMAKYVQDEINLAEQGGDGYYRNFTFPDTILSHKYKIEIIDGEYVYAYTTDAGGVFDSKHALSLRTQKITTESSQTDPITKVFLVRIDGINSIVNQDGEVRLFVPTQI